MVTRRQGAPLLRGALAAGLASQRGEDAAQWVAGWSVPSLPLTVPFPALASGGTATQLMPRLDGRG
jgi:hypothetical protein